MSVPVIVCVYTYVLDCVLDISLCFGISLYARVCARACDDIIIIIIISKPCADTSSMRYIRKTTNELTVNHMQRT